ncbi:MAG TPA: hypothetical protein VFE46_15190 [Pirellulales bacterium]|jgi:hypothetical protein|nr:hypothetical protein [Pirellulales bacterium]
MLSDFNPASAARRRIGRRKLPTTFRATLWGAALGALAFWPTKLQAQVLVPGAGQQLTQVGDDFEDPKWEYIANEPKSSEEQDHQERLPSGHSTNGRWAEGLKRGQPDVVKRVATPPGGIPSSKGSMLLMSLYTGVPGVFSGQTHQDDFIGLVDQRIGGSISVSRSPSVVAHVYVPTWAKWERRDGNSFCFRAACDAYTTKASKSFFGFGGSQTVLDEYWPGMMFYFHPGDGQKTKDYCTLRVRAGMNGADYNAVDIKEPGWWTLGMSFTPDGQIHYFAHAGVDPLTAKDRIASETPYGMRCEHFKCFFFDVLNGDNGNWSTPWVVDDCFAYTAR